MKEEGRGTLGHGQKEHERGGVWIRRKVNQNSIVPISYPGNILRIIQTVILYDWYGRKQREQLRVNHASSTSMPGLHFRAKILCPGPTHITTWFSTVSNQSDGELWGSSFP